MRKNKNITIVALAVTIIVLIILAGISINLTLGENGIITKAKLAKEQYLNAQEEEQSKLATLSNELNLSSSNGPESDESQNEDESKVTIDKEAYEQLLNSVNNLKETCDQLSNDLTNLKNNSVSKETYEQLLNDVTKLKTNTIKYPDFSRRLTQIKEPNFTWVATEDCCIIGTLTADSPATAYIRGNGSTLASIANQRAEPTVMTTLGVCVYVPKGVTINNRPDGGQYNLTVYAVK